MATSTIPDVPSLFKDRQSLTPAPRKRPNTVAMLMLFLMVALITFGIVRSQMTKTKAPETVTIVGSGADLQPGTRLGFANVHYIEMPKKYYSDNMFTSSEQACGYLTRVYLPMGEPITKDQLFAKKYTLSGNLESYERAVALKLDEDALVDHEIYSNDYVDVLVTASKDGKHYTKTVCQNVRVLLSTTKEAAESKGSASNNMNRITLAATPEQAELLSEAVETGKIRLALRSPLSRTKFASAGVKEDDLLPNSALVKTTNAIVATAQPKLTLVPAPPPLPAAPPMDMGAPAPALQEAGQWLVEMFTGSHKDVYAVPLSQR